MTTAVKIQHALQAALGAYTFLRTEASATPEADRAAVTASVLADVESIGLAHAELAELRTIIANAPTHEIREPAILGNLAALHDLASELDDEERRDMVVKLQALIDRA